MSSVANWSYTADATIWRKTGQNAYGDPVFAEPVVIKCDYQGGLAKQLGNLGGERIVRNTVWSEYAEAKTGDYLLIGISFEADPRTAGADEVMSVTRYADTFERLAEDFAIITGA